MIRKTDFYIDGAWVAPAVPNQLEVINPADETAFATISLGSAADVDRAVDAARAASTRWSATNRAQRMGKHGKVATIYARHSAEMATEISQALGATITVDARAEDHGQQRKHKGLQPP